MGGPIDRCSAERLLRRALKAFFKSERMPSGVAERAITHRLAVHLERELSSLDRGDLSVDCEYNRNGHVDPKRLDRLALDLTDGTTAADLVQDTDARTVFPDIIVHERGVREANEIVIEVKRASAAARPLQADREKLELYKTQAQLGYRNAFLLVVDLAAKTARIETAGQDVDIQRLREFQERVDRCSAMTRSVFEVLVDEVMQWDGVENAIDSKIDGMTFYRTRPGTPRRRFLRLDPKHSARVDNIGVAFFGLDPATIVGLTGIATRDLVQDGVWIYLHDAEHNAALLTLARQAYGRLEA